MPIGSLSPFSKSMRTGALVAGAVGIVTGALAWFQAESERRIDTEDVDRRARALAHQISFSVRSALQQPDADAAAVLNPRLEGFRRLLGFTVFRPDGRPVASAKAVSEFSDAVRGPVDKVLQGEPEVTETLRPSGPPIHILATALKDDQGALQGVLLVVHDVSYIDERATARLAYSVFWILFVTLILVTAVVGATWIAYDRPLHNLAQWMKRVRVEGSIESPPSGLPSGLLSSESDRLAASFRAARSSGRVESRAVVRAEKVWTSDRLRTFAVDCLGAQGQLVVASSREPYSHLKRDGQTRVVIPPGGLVTALNPVLMACGGLWVAHGTGDADRETVDDHGRVTVPPDDPRYTLRRIWLSPEEEKGFYGCCNEALWPLCHHAHERPIFRTSDWQQYVRINQRFADTILAEVGPSEATVLVQDYQLALVPRMLKAARPNLRVGLFWHIPWPNPEAVRICPWRAEILRGVLGADIVAFHLAGYCNNFLDTIDRMLEARLDRDHLSVELQGRTSLVRAIPISVQNWSERGVPAGEDLARQIEQLKAQYRLAGLQIAVGVDRIDHTKGLPERFRAVAHFLEKYPQHRGRFTLVQLASPSRTHLPRCLQHIEELKAYAEKINRQFQTGDWQPIHLLIDQHNGATVHAWLRMASMAIVSSLHDGMNLVAKEYVAAQELCEGVLILSEFAGASRELSEALIINPYDTEQFADAIRYAAEMPAEERQARMDRMRRKVEEHNIYRWAADLLAVLAASSSDQSLVSRQTVQS